MTGYSPEVRKILAQEKRLNKFLQDRKRLNKELEESKITPKEYADRHRAMRQRLQEQTLSVSQVIKGMEYNSNRLKTSLFHAMREKDADAQLGRLEETIESTILDLETLHQDLRILRQFDHPHVLLRLQVHPCLGCIGFNQLEPEEHHECCEDCPDIDDRRSWECERDHYNDIIEVG